MAKAYSSSCLAPAHPTCPARPRLYLHRIQAHRLPLLQGLASSLEQKEHSHWLPKPIATSPSAWTSKGGKQLGYRDALALSKGQNPVQEWAEEAGHQPGSLS